MTVLAVSAEDGWSGPALAALLTGLPPGAPVVILIHGFRYAPGVAGHDPHQLILSPTRDRRRGRLVSWPWHLGLTGAGGLAIAFGWNARGDIWSAYARAGAAGAVLARLIGCLRRQAPDRPVHVMAHSLGARVVLAALPLCAPGDVGRMILLAGAAFRRDAVAAMASPAGRSAEVLHVRGTQNALFEALLRLAFPLSGQTLAAGLPERPCWVEMTPEAPGTQAALRRLGFALGPAGRRICHWSCYARPGLFAVYRALLDDRLSVADLRPPVEPLAPPRQRAAVPPGVFRIVKRLTARS